MLGFVVLIQQVGGDEYFLSSLSASVTQVLAAFFLFKKSAIKYITRSK